jgi:hypothetical protein
MRSPADERAVPLRSCLVALVTRLLAPASYLVLVGFYPIRRLDLGLGAAVGWLFLTVIVVPTAVAVLLLVLSGRGRRRR